MRELSSLGSLNLIFHSITTFFQDGQGRQTEENPRTWGLELSVVLGGTGIRGYESDVFTGTTIIYTFSEGDGVCMGLSRVLLC